MYIMILVISINIGNGVTSSQSVTEWKTKESCEASAKYYNSETYNNFLRTAPYVSVRVSANCFVK